MSARALAVELTLDEIPANVIERTKYLIIDSLGCALVAAAAGGYFGAIVSTIGHDGRVNTVDVAKATGVDELALTNADIRSKYHALTRTVIDADRSQALAETVLDLEHRSLTDLLSLLRPVVHPLN